MFSSGIICFVCNASSLLVDKKNNKKKHYEKLLSLYFGLLSNAKML